MSCETPILHINYILCIKNDDKENAHTNSMDVKKKPRCETL